MGKGYYRAAISLWCFLLAFNGWGMLDAWHKRDYTWAIFGAVLVGFCWKRIWAIYDESRED